MVLSGSLPPVATRSATAGWPRLVVLSSLVATTRSTPSCRTVIRPTMSNRARVHVAPEQCCGFDDRVGFQPDMASIKALYDRGQSRRAESAWLPESGLLPLPFDGHLVPPPSLRSGDRRLARKTVREMDPRADTC